MLTFNYEKVIYQKATNKLYIPKQCIFHVPVMGIDEVGRGCIAGPVVASAVVLKKSIPNDALLQIKDSKKLSKKKRLFLYNIIIKHSLYAISVINVSIIDKINILHASLLAMSNASRNLITQDKSICGILIDGIHKFSSDIEIQTLISGDNKSLSIAAASIVSKVYRDNLMLHLASKYPNYGWEKNVGYGTKQHLSSLGRFPITEYHRTSFAPVKNLFYQYQNENLK